MPPFAQVRSIPVAEGRYPNWDDEREVRRVAFLGSDAKKQLFGGRPALGETIRVGDFPYTVIGVMRHKEQDSSYDGQDIAKVFVPFSTVRRDFPSQALHHRMGSGSMTLRSMTARPRSSSSRLSSESRSVDAERTEQALADLRQS